MISVQNKSVKKSNTDGITIKGNFLKNIEQTQLQRFIIY